MTFGDLYSDYAAGSNASVDFLDFFKIVDPKHYAELKEVWMKSNDPDFIQIGNVYSPLRSGFGNARQLTLTEIKPSYSKDGLNIEVLIFEGDNGQKYETTTTIVPSNSEYHNNEYYMNAQKLLKLISKA